MGDTRSGRRISHKHARGKLAESAPTPKRFQPSCRLFKMQKACRSRRNHAKTGEVKQKTGCKRGARGGVENPRCSSSSLFSPVRPRETGCKRECNQGDTESVWGANAFSKTSRDIWFLSSKHMQNHANSCKMCTALQNSLPCSWPAKGPPPPGALKWSTTFKRPFPLSGGLKGAAHQDSTLTLRTGPAKRSLQETHSNEPCGCCGTLLR